MALFKLLILTFYLLGFQDAALAEESIYKTPPPACSATSTKSALVIIDMQKFFVQRNGAYTEPANNAKFERTIEMQLAAIEKAKAANIHVVLIEYDCHGCDRSDPRLRAAIATYNNVRVFKKVVDGMLDDWADNSTQLKNFLTRNDIGTLIVAGANGGACVAQSIRGALRNNCSVIAFSDGIADFNYKDFIYPYTSRYLYFQKPKCESCSFKEVSSIEDIGQYMNSSVRSTPVNSTKPSNSQHDSGVR